jgi:hypothetical protein
MGRNNKDFFANWTKASEMKAGTHYVGVNNSSNLNWKHTPAIAVNTEGVAERGSKAARHLEAGPYKND